MSSGITCLQRLACLPIEIGMKLWGHVRSNISYSQYRHLRIFGHSQKHNILRRNWSQRVNAANWICSSTICSEKKSGHVRNHILIDRSSTVIKNPEDNGSQEYSSVQHSADVELVDRFVVKYVEEENEYFHKYLEVSTSYKMYLLPGFVDSVETSVDSERMEEALAYASEDFETLMKSLGNLSTLPLSMKKDLFSNEEFKTLCFCLIGRLNSCSDEELFECMKVLSLFDFRTWITTQLRPLRLAIARAFDKECLLRSSRWDVKSLFLAADFFYVMRCSSMQWVTFLPMMFCTMEDHLETLSKSELVLLLYHANLARRTPEGLMSKLSSRVLNQINSFSVEEVGITCLGFFKTNQKVKNQDVLENVLGILQEKSRNLDPVCLSSIVKCLQKSTNKTMVHTAPDVFQALVNLQPVLLPVLQNLPTQTSLHILSLFENIRDISENMILALCKRLLEEDLADWRFKDLARASRLLGNLSCKIPSKREVFRKLITELESPSRAVDLENYPDCLCTCLLGMIMEEVYPHSLIEFLFSDRSQKSLQNQKLEFDRDLFQISESIRIERPEYAGPLLPSDFIANLSKNSQVFGRLPKIKNGGRSLDSNNMSLRDSMILQLTESLSKILGGKEYFSVTFLLSHYQTVDIELCVHSCGKPLPMSKWTKFQAGRLIQSVKSQPSNISNPVASRLFDLATREPTRWIAVLLHGANGYFTLRGADGSSTASLLGYHAMKGRQLRKLGYEVVEIPYFEYSQVKQKDDYLKLKIFGKFYDDLD